MESTKKSGLALILTGAHSMMCPVHGILPNAARVAGVSSAALTEYKLLKPFAWTHKKEAVAVDYILQEINPQTTTHEHHHREHHNHNHTHPYTEATVAGINYTFMVISAYFFAKAMYKKFKGKQ